MQFLEMLVQIQFQIQFLKEKEVPALNTVE